MGSWFDIPSCTLTVEEMKEIDEACYFIHWGAGKRQQANRAIEMAAQGDLRAVEYAKGARQEVGAEAWRQYSIKLQIARKEKQERSHCQCTNHP